MTAEEERIGLCARCHHVRRVRSGKGGTFYLCERSQTDPRFPKYPNLPVRACAGYEEEEGSVRGERRAPG